jgi:carotenoid cleavage dioxygenase-like enzyme
MSATQTRGSIPTRAQVGFTSLDQEIRVDRLPVEGTVPPWLQGSLIRTGPAKWEVGSRTMNHWFDGLAMLHRFGFAGGEVSYANRFLETRAWRSARDRGEIGYAEFATDPCRSLFQRVTAMFSPQLTDNANVSLTKVGDRFVAMTETPIPVQFDPGTLAAAGVAYRPPGQLTTAHPHLDRATGGMLNYAAKLGPRTSYRFFLLRPDSSSPEVIGSYVVREPAYMHSFGLTERWLVLAEFPFVVNPLRLASGRRPYIENYRWKPERGTRFHLFDRRTGEHAGPFTTEARFGFHHVNAFDEDDGVVVDICTFPDAGIVEDLYLQRLRDGKPAARPALERFRITPGTGEVRIEQPVPGAAFELPRINYSRCNERSYRYVWGVGLESGWFDRIVKADLKTGSSGTWASDGAYPGEPVFVAAPDAAGEDDGVLLSVVLGADGTSFLLVLDAGSMTELARALVPHHIPFGFHGMYSSGG